MDLAKSVVAAIIERLGCKARVCMVAMVIVMASLTMTFAAAVVWDVAGRITTVVSEKGKVEVKLDPRSLSAKR